MLDGRRSRWLLGCALLISMACDGGSADPDAGPPDGGMAPPVTLTVTRARATPTIPTSGGAQMAPAGAQYYVLDVTLASHTLGPLPIAPNAFTLRLADDTPANANPGATNAIEGGCVSQSVPVGESRSCLAVFAVALDAADPATLSWSNGTRTFTATVPALVMP